MTDPFTALSDQLAARVAVAAPGLVSIYPGTRAERSGFAWQTGLVVTSEQDLPPGTDVPVMLPGGGSATAVVAGRDPGTNIALLRLEIEAPALGDSTPATGAMVLAMGAENAVFERDGEVVGLTYMTGALVKVGQRLTLALLGGPCVAWAGYFGLWIGLIAGAVTGAAFFPLFGFAGLWFAAAAAAVLAVVAARL